MKRRKFLASSLATPFLFKLTNYKEVYIACFYEKIKIIVNNNGKWEPYKIIKKDPSTSILINNEYLVDIHEVAVLKIDLYKLKIEEVDPL